MKAANDSVVKIDNRRAVDQVGKPRNYTDGDEESISVSFRECYRGENSTTMEAFSRPDRQATEAHGRRRRKHLRFLPCVSVAKNPRIAECGPLLDKAALP